jgi:AcrR family transcriptional regulator
MELPSTGFGGQRERNKTEKLRRIKDAARKLFIRKGFDEATTREIAREAEVGVGTVFTYAENKRDLLFLVANDELEAVTRAAEALVTDNASLLNNLMHFFGHHYDFFGRQPVLSRMMLREMTFYSAGRQAARFQENRDLNIRIVGDIVAREIRAGGLRTKERADFVGWVLFCIYQVELRRWLTTGEPLKAGLAQLQRALRLCIEGLAPSAALRQRKRGALAPSRKRKT